MAQQKQQTETQSATPVTPEPSEKRAKEVSVKTSSPWRLSLLILVAAISTALLLRYKDAFLKAYLHKIAFRDISIEDSSKPVESAQTFESLDVNPEQKTAEAEAIDAQTQIQRVFFNDLEYDVDLYWFDTNEKTEKKIYTMQAKTEMNFNTFLVLDDLVSSDIH